MRLSEHRADERVVREAEIYNDGALERDSLEARMAYTQCGPARRRRDALIRAVHGRHCQGRVLEIGSQAWESHFCKYGMSPTQLTCINISERELDQGRAAAHRRGVRIDFQLMDAHELQFADGSFDLVFGAAILHHLDFERALREISRVTKPGGEILFVEPLLLNPVARLVRALTPRARTPDERPLARKELRVVSRYFEPEHLYTDLFAFPAALLADALHRSPDSRLTQWADRADSALAARLPGLGAYYRTVTIHGQRPH